MLMFIFGAGASFDSDPERRDPRERVAGYNFRPPLASGLFQPDNDAGREAIAEFPRVGDLIMALREATRAGSDVEEVLETVQARSAVYPETATVLLAFRAYLARVMSQVPSKWVKECQGLTNYVRVLSQTDRWNKISHSERQAIGCVTFNYDRLLEDAAEGVFGHQVRSMESFVSRPDVHIFKPHGSVTWQQAATWNVERGHHLPGIQGLHMAIDEAPSLSWIDDQFRFELRDEFQDTNDQSTVWLPALSIPVRRKSAFTMPEQHKTAMVADLEAVTTLIAIGWRARERHFLDLLQHHLGRSLVRLVAVAESDKAAMETVDNLWQVGRFDRYAISGQGFSAFTEELGPSYERPSESGGHARLTLHHVLTAGADSDLWVERGPAYDPMPPPTEVDFVNPGYADL